jgi:surface antigen
MAGPEARRVFRHRYSGTAVASLRLAVALALALCASGCAVTGMGSLFGKEKEQAAGDVTGSSGALAANAQALPADTDLVFAKLAIVEVLQRGAKEASAPWENPSSGARGTVTPIASAYDRDGSTCRDFLASYVLRRGSETWMQGEACRVRKGPWEVKSLRPWTRS